MRYERDISMQKGKKIRISIWSVTIAFILFYEHKFKINWTHIDSWWGHPRGQIVSEWICDHDYNWHIEGKWSRIYKTIWTIDSWRLDSDRNGIFTTDIVNFTTSISLLHSYQSHSNAFARITSIYFYSYTKASIVSSVVFVLDRKTELISAPHALVYLGIVIFLVYFKMSSILLGIHDPFLPFENLICTLCFGGIWDKLAKLLGYGQAKDETKDTKKSN